MLLKWFDLLFVVVVVGVVVGGCVGGVGSGCGPLEKMDCGEMGRDPALSILELLPPLLLAASLPSLLESALTVFVADDGIDDDDDGGGDVAVAAVVDDLTILAAAFWSIECSRTELAGVLAPPLLSPLPLPPPKSGR